MKWFELLREQYDCPTVFLQIPTRATARSPPSTPVRGRPAEGRGDPALEKATGRKYDEERVRHYLSLSAAAEEDLVAVLHSAKRKPSPIDAYFGAVYYVGPIFFGLPPAPRRASLTYRSCGRRSRSAWRAARDR